jgi:4,5-dihydroxyphthalate decarboxylase
VGLATIDADNPCRHDGVEYCNEDDAPPLFRVLWTRTVEILFLQKLVSFVLFVLNSFHQSKEQSPMAHESNRLKLETLLGDYPNTLALKNGSVRSPDVEFAFADVKVPSTAFKDVVRNLKYDFAELAIVTFLQAKTHGKPLALLPAVVVGTLPHPFLAYNAERGHLTPADLKGRRVGIRAYSVTTAAWIRGILQNDHGVDLDSIRWVTFEDPHVAEYHDPSTAERAPTGKRLAQMLLDGEIDAGLVGESDLKDPRLQSIIPNPHDTAQAWCRDNGTAPINHMAVVKESLLKTHPSAVKEIFRLLKESKQKAPAAGGIDSIRFGVENVRRGLEMIIEYAVQQRLIPRKFIVAELFDDVTRAL